MVGELQMSDIQGAITTAIATIHESVQKATANGITLTESMTETIVIDPILAALGYAVWEYQKQGTAEGIGNIPDYTIMPKAPNQWFLEVKRWQLPLTDKEANQTVGYAFAQGSRWAILTNGDEWRIYDAHCKEHLTEKCIYTIKSLSDAGSVELLTLLAKESMGRDLLSITYRNRLIKEAIQKELSSVTSETIKALRKAVQSHTSLMPTKEEVSIIVKSFINQPTPPMAIPDDLSPSSTPIIERSEPSLLDLSKNQPSPSNRTLEAVILPDGTVTIVSDWRDVTRTVVRWCANQYGMPKLPFNNGTKGHATRYFLNTTPFHIDGSEMCVFDTVESSSQTVYMYLHNSAHGFCRILSLFMQAINADPSMVRIRFKEQN